MAKPNYQFEKRQKELAKKNKKEEKRRQKDAAVEDTGSATVANATDAPTLTSPDASADQAINALPQ